MSWEIVEPESAQKPQQTIYNEIVKLNGLGQYDTQSSYCVETKLAQPFEQGDLWEYRVEFALGLSNWETDTTGFNPYWRMTLSLDGFTVSPGQDVILQHLDFTVSRNGNDSNNVACVGCTWRKSSLQNLYLQITAIESVSQNKPSSYVGDCYLSIAFLSNTKLI